MKQCLFVMLMTLLSSFSVFAQKYTGRVYVDANANGVYDKREKTLSNVAVSDGLNVVLTNKKGEYSLPGHAQERFVFITTPSGYKTNNDYYKRINSDFGVYDFGVMPYASGIQKDGSHSFIHLSDTEITKMPKRAEWVSNLRDIALNEEMAFIVHTGDICYPEGLKNHIKLMNTKIMGTPVFYTLGNHDLVKGEYGEQLFEKYYGPVWYSFDVGSVHYIATPMLNGDYAPRFKKEEVIDWIKNDLALVPKDKPIVMLCHELYLVFNNSYDFLREHNLKAWLYGHWHINLIREYDGIAGICTSTPANGGIDHSSSAYRIMNMDAKGDFISDLRYSYIDSSLKIASTNPISVNTYSSISQTKEVKYSCAYDGKMIVKNRLLTKNTDWNWSGDLKLASIYEGKSITLTVESIFTNGMTSTAKQSFIYKNSDQSRVKLNGDWTNLLGNSEHIGISESVLLNSKDEENSLNLQWVNNVGSNIYMTSPIILGENVYVASVDENKRGKASVSALNALSGDIVWQYPTKNSVKNTIVAWKSKNGRGSIMSQDVEGNLYCLDAENGKLFWEIKLDVKLVPALNDGLVVKDGIVYAGSGKGLCAVDVETGKILWKNTGWLQGEGTTVTSTIYPLGDGNGVLVGGAQWGGMYANDLKSGKFLWSNKESDIRSRASSPSVYNGLLYFVSSDAFLMVNPLNGKLVVRKSLPFGVDVTSTPLLTDDEIIFGSTRNGIIAIDSKTFEKKWEFTTGNALIYSAPYAGDPAATVETSPVLSGNTVFMGASDGVLYGINRSDGKLQWKHETGAPVFATVSISGNVLYAVDFSGNVYCFVTN